MKMLKVCPSRPQSPLPTIRVQVLYVFLVLALSPAAEAAS